MGLIDRLNTTVNDFAGTITSPTLANKVRIGHFNRMPNCLNLKYMNGRMNYEYVQFNQRNIVFDMYQLQPIELDRLIELAKMELYKTTWYYLPLQKQIQHDMKSDFTLETYLPVHFATGIFTYVPNVASVIDNINITDPEGVATNQATTQGYVLLKQGLNQIELSAGQSVLILFDTQIISEHPSRLYTQTTSETIKIYQKQDTVVYLFTPEDMMQTFQFDKRAYVLNYHYELMANSTNVYQQHFIEPIVFMVPSKQI